MNWILGSDFTVFLLLHHCAIKHYSTVLFIPDRVYALSHTAKLILYQFGWMIRNWLFLDLEPLWSVPSVGMVERGRKITTRARKRHILLSLLGLFLLAYYSGRLTMWTPSLGTSLAEVDIVKTLQGAVLCSRRVGGRKNMHDTPLLYGKNQSLTNNFQIWSNSFKMVIPESDKPLIDK